MLLRSFLAALTFLTLVPAPGSRMFAQREISVSRGFYPLIGLLIGLLLVALERGAIALFSQPPGEWAVLSAVPPFSAAPFSAAPLTAAVLLVALLVITRGLHFDGFMDVCDGLFGGYTRERRLEIMRDSHVGSFAVAGGTALLILKYGALFSLLSYSGAGKSWVLLAFPMLSRWSMVILLQFFPYVREAGLGSPFHGADGKPWIAAGFALLVTAGVSIVLGGIGGAALMIGVSLLAVLIGLTMTRILGGLTGDIYGATNELVEATVLIAAVALLPYGLLKPLAVPFW